MRLATLVATVCVGSTVVSACSDFLLNSTVNVMSGRTMDFQADLHTVVEVIPRGTTFQELPILDCVECADYAWQSKYGFVALNMFGLNVASDGLNERGLSAAWLYLTETQYPTPQKQEANVKDPSKPIVTSVCSYLLGNFATVDEVREGLKTFQIAEFDERIQVPLLHSNSLGRVPLHVSIHDAEGKSLVIEFIKGETKLYDNLNKVLTNDPPLDQQLAALVANGEDAIPGGYGSTERFLRVSVLNYHAPMGYSNAVPDASYTLATDEQRGVSDTLHILNTVVRPPLSCATEWNIIRDHSRTKLYFQSTQNMALRVIDLTKLDFANATSRRLIPVTFGPWSVDVTSALQSTENHAKTMDLPSRTQMEQLLQQLLHGGGLPPSTANEPSTSTKNGNVVMEAADTSYSSPSTPPTSPAFMFGVLTGAALVVVSMSLYNFAMNLRRRTYNPIYDPAEVRYAI